MSSEERRIGSARVATRLWKLLMYRPEIQPLRWLEDRGILFDCQSTTLAGTELFLLESLQAAAKFKAARRRQTQAAFFLPDLDWIGEGPPPTKDPRKPNLNLFLEALGCGAGFACDPELLRYERVIPCMSREGRGPAVRNQLLAAFFTELRPIIEDRRVEVGVPPVLEVLAPDGRRQFAFTRAEATSLLERRSPGAIVHRYGGLDEVSGDSLRQSMLDPQTRRVRPITVCDEGAILEDHFELPE